MSPITTHVLDTSLGRPAAGVAVSLARLGGGVAAEVATGVTDADGRVTDLLAPGAFTPGCYRLSFDTASYFTRTGRETFYPSVEVTFQVVDPTQHFHVPLLVAPFGYSTYRGS